MPRRPAQALTARNLPAILKGDAWVADTLISGLALRPLGDGRGAWLMRYVTSSGQRRQMTLGRTPPLDLAGAREEASRILLRVKAGEDPAAQLAREKGKLSSSPTLAELIERYVAAGGSGYRGRTGLAPKTAYEYRRQAEQLAKDPVVGSIAVIRLRRPDFRALFVRVREAHGPVAANRIHSLVRAAVSWAVSWEILDVDYTTGIRPVSTEVPAGRALGDDELAALWQATTHAPVDAAVLVRLMMLLGQRPTETATIGLKHLKREGDLILWEIPAATHKQRRGHVVPLPDFALEQLELLGEARAQAGAQHPDDGRVLGASASCWRRWWSPIVRRTLELLEEQRAKRGGRGPAPLPFTRHDIRRSVATGMVRRGIPLATVSRVLGHSTATQSRLGGVAQVTADVYVRDRQVRDSLTALTAWSEHVAALAADRERGKVLPFAR